MQRSGADLFGKFSQTSARSSFKHFSPARNFAARQSRKLLTRSVFLGWGSIDTAGKSSYRSIGNIAAISKLLVRLIARQFIGYLCNVLRLPAVVEMAVVLSIAFLDREISVPVAGGHWTRGNIAAGFVCGHLSAVDHAAQLQHFDSS
jgi:hypothetical protein